MPKYVDLYLMRHGPTDWSTEKRLQGRADRPLSKQGKETVERWSTLAPKATRILSSPLIRAHETATILYPSRVVETDLRLIEMDFGTWEGHSIKELRAQFGEVFEAEEARGLDMQPPEGESPRQVQARLRPVLAELALRGEATSVIAHKGVLRALYAWASGWDMTTDPPEKLQEGCFHHLRVSAMAELSVIALNQPLHPTGVS